MSLTKEKQIKTDKNLVAVNTNNFRSLKNKEGITLIALIVTIVVLIILAGISILFFQQYKLLDRATYATDEYQRQSVKEKLEMKIADLQIKIWNYESRNCQLGDLDSFVDSQSKYYDIEIVSVTDELDEITGKNNKRIELDGYSFLVDENLKIIENVSDKEDNNSDEGVVSQKALRFVGDNYIKTKVKQEQLFISNYTIALQIRINREEQQKVSYMGILGDHNGTSGLGIQFEGTSEQLMLVVNGEQSSIDYKNYYDKWTDIVVVCNGETTKLYINKEIKAEINAVANPMQDKNILFGTSVATENRAMKGIVYATKIWSDELNLQEIVDLNMSKLTNIKKDNIVFESFVGDANDLSNLGELQNERVETILWKEEYEKIFKLKGNTYFDTGITQQELYHENYTIALQVKINKEEQQSVGYMGLLGDHNASRGLAIQFYRTNNELLLAINGVNESYIDYEAYYDKWTDIVVVCNAGTTQLYINRELKAEVEKKAQVMDGCNILMGTSLSNEDRAMKGNITTGKIWKTALTKEEVQKLDMHEENTKLQKDFLLQEYLLQEEVENFKGNNYDYEYDYSM